MGFLDKITDMMHLGNDYDDDGYDEFDDEFDDDDDFGPKKSIFRKKGADADDDFEDPKPRRASALPAKVAPRISAVGKRKGGAMDVCVFKPTRFEESREITETLLSGSTIVLNFEGLDVEIAQRIIDFACGSCFAIGGNLQKVSNYIFVVTPKSVDITGDIQDILSGAFDIPNV